MSVSPLSPPSLMPTSGETPPSLTNFKKKAEFFCCDLSGWTLLVGTIGLALVIIGGLNLNGTISWSMSSNVALGLHFGGVLPALFLIPALYSVAIACKGDLP